MIVDPGQIEQVIMNLAINARDAMPQGGKLTIETANVCLDEAYCRKHIDVVPDKYVMLAVSDTGIGMDGDTLSHIFEPFFTTKAHGKGTGLGLATVYGIIKQSRGHIWIYSEISKGSTYKVYFPAEEMKPEVSVEPHMAPQAFHGTETIIIAEDNAGVRELAEAILEQQGYRVLVAGNGQECLSQLFEHKGTVDLLLTDVVMPDMNGKVLAEKASERIPTLKVLFMSGYTDNVIIRQGVLEEGVHFIQKPFSVQTLDAKVWEVMNSATK